MPWKSGPARASPYLLDVLDIFQTRPICTQRHLAVASASPKEESRLTRLDIRAFVIRPLDFVPKLAAAGPGVCNFVEQHTALDNKDNRTRTLS